MKNPEVVRYDGDSYVIRYVRYYKVLMWVQDITERKMKDTSVVKRPVVLFKSKEQAEKEVLDVVIPYLLNTKEEDPSRIVGWNYGPI